MNECMVLGLLANNLELTLTLALPLAGTALVIGLVSSLVQAATSVHEPNLTLVPKLVGVAGVAFAMGPWLLGRLVLYTTALYGDFTRFIH